MKYTVESCFYLADLIRVVTDKMVRGWVPQGGIYETGDKYMQAMIREEKDET